MNARPLHYDWVLSIRDQCIAKGAHFQFRQCGTHFIKNGKKYTLKVEIYAVRQEKQILIVDYQLEK